MTTNGLLLNKYMDFLVENNFSLLISLDGNKTDNCNRILQNGKHSFSLVKQNCDLLMKKYPAYFASSVNFNTVFTKDATIKSIIDFFYKSYNKFSSLTAISPDGIRLEKRKEYLNMYNNLFTNVSKYVKLKNSNRLFSLGYNTISSIFLRFFRHYYYMYFNFISTNMSYPLPACRNGTCTPFFKKIYVDVDGNILPCEKVADDIIYGKIIDDTLHINFNKIMKWYNDYQIKNTQVCAHCMIHSVCSECMFTSFNHGCRNFKTAKIFENDMTNIIDAIENHRDIFDALMDSVKYEEL